MLPVRFKSAGTAVWAANIFNKSANKHRDKRYLTMKSSSCSSSCLLEDCTDQKHPLPPHHHATKGELEALQDAVKDLGLTLKERDKNQSTLLHYATEANQVSVMKYLIENGVDLDAADKDGNTALHLATQGGYTETIHLLLDSGANTTVVNKMKDPPLHTAAREKSGQALKAYLSHSAVDYQARGYRSRTILHAIAEVDNLECCKVLQEAVAKKVDKGTHLLSHCIKDDDGLTALHLAARKNSHQVLDFFFLQCKSVSMDRMLHCIDEENSTPLHIAVDAGNFEVACVLLKYGASPLVMKEDIPPPLHLACSQGKLEIVKAMMESAGKEILQMVDQNKRTPLHYSVFSIHSTCIITHIMEEGKEGIDINQQDSKGRTPLHMSISSGNLTSVKELLARGADPFLKDSAGHNALHFAVLYNRTAIIQVLLEIPNSEELANEINSKGYSPVHIGLKLGQRDIVSMLISSIQLQANNVKDPHGNNYIHLAASSGDWKALSSFLELANAHKLLNDTNKHGDTPLHHASKNGHSHCIEFLLNSGAMVHKCHNGMSPLMLACREGHIECAKLLFKAHPFQIDWQDDSGETALHYAAHSGSPSMIQQALDLGGQVMHNDDGKSFLDIIISNGNENCGLAVVNHRRWQECLDMVSLILEDPMLGLIKQMPSIAKAVLDRCHTEEHSSDNVHQTHTETFNFKYLLSPESGIEQQPACNQDSCADKKKDRRHLLTRRKSLHEVAIVDLEVADADLRSMTMHRKRSVLNRPKAANSGKKRKTSHTMEVLKRMIQYKRVDLLIHPVVSAYLKKKWKSYGRFCYSLYFGTLSLLIFSLTLFVLLAPRSAFETGRVRPQMENASVNLTSPGPTQLRNVSGNATFDDVPANSAGYVEFSTAQQVVRWVAVVANTMFAFDTFIGLVVQGLTFINFVDRILSWNSVIAIILNYIFLLSPNPFHITVLPFGAGACFFSWIVIFGALEFFDILGIYVNMFFKILRTAFQVLFACTFLLMAFALAMYMIANKVTEFSSVGFSLFSVFGYMLGEIQYSLFIEKAISRKETDPSPNLSSLIIVFVILLAIMMSIVMANLLIGLAVGDIENIKLNATYQRRALEVGYFTHLDNYTPNFLRHIIAPESCVVQHGKGKCHIERLVNYFKRILKFKVLDHVEETQNVETQRTTDDPVDIALEMSQIKRKLQQMSDMMQNLQEGEKDCHRRRQQCFRWQKPQSSLSIDSSQSMTASDFLADFA